MSAVVPKRSLLPLSSLVVLVIISLAAALYPGGDQMVDPEIGLVVQSTWVSMEGPEGLTPVRGRTWQYLDVDLRNGNRDASIQVSVPHFFALTDGGERIWVHNSEDFSYPALGPGENLTVHLVFMVGSGTELVELEYIQRVSGPARCAIPPL